MLRITINNNQGRVQGDVRSIIKLRKELCLKHPGAFYLRTGGHMPKGWDGKIYYVSESGYFDIGLLPRILNLCMYQKADVEIEDNRDFEFSIDIPKKLPGGQEPRPYQVSAVESVLEQYIGRYKIKDVYFPQGILFAATNAGKTIISALIHQSIKIKGGNRTVLLLNQSDLFADCCREIPQMLGEDEVGWIQGNKIKWANFMICMVPTLRTKMSIYMAKLSKYNTLIFDECDTATAPTNKPIIRCFINTVVRVGMSGSIDKHRDKTKNMNVHRLFGDVTFKISNKELVDLGFSSKVDISILPGNIRPGIAGDYDLEYNKNIIKNKDRNKFITQRVVEKVKSGKTPILVISRRHKHINILYKRIREALGDGVVVRMVHHKTKDRYNIQLDFANGKIDVLVGSYILKRGKNFPLMKTLINCGGGDSSSDVLQILGRAMRKHESKEKTDVEDFWDTGEYLRRHSLHRYNAYKAEGLPLEIKFNPKLLKYKTL